ncbi:MAG: hypothetical protein EBX35_11175, partial [Planctomycetia bacterium]|nr:hypothetical protein [Planctomycetia bacterium]
GGLVVDTNSFSVTFSNPLLGADGTVGVTQPDITIPTAGNSGYAGAPMVRFAAPAAAGGVPASGYALISGGQVTGIVVTNPGTYAAGETPQITLTGGGGSIAAFNTSALATANTSAGLTKTGAGTLALGSATSTFSGPVVVNAGTVQASGTGTLANIGSPSAFGVGNNASDATNAASVVLNGGTWSIINTGGPVTTNRLFTLTPNGGALVTDNATATDVITFGNPAPIAYTGSGPRTLTLGGSHAGGTNANTFAPQITDAGSGVVSVTKSGATNWRLTNAANSYTGGTNIQQGILGFTSGALAPTGSIAFTGNSTLQWATGNVDDVSGRLVMTNGVAATLDTFGNAVTLASAIGNASSGSLVKAGTGTLTLTAANTYTGTSTIAAGTLALGVAETPGTAGPLGNQAAAAAGSILMTGGTLQYSAVNTNDYSGRFSTAGGQTWNIDTNSQSVTFATALQGATSGLSKFGTGTLTLSGANTYAGNTIVNGGTLNITGSITGNTTTTRLDYGATAGTTIVNHSGNLTAWVTRGADVAGAVSVFNQTAGTVTIVPTNGQDQQYLANNGGYGMLNITGGTFRTGRFDGVGATSTNTSTAVIYVGGAGTLNQNVGDWFLPIRNNGMMSMTIAAGGSFARSSAVTAEFSLIGLNQTVTTGTTSYGVLNVAGGTVDTGPTKGISISSGTFSPGGTNLGFVNAAAGTLQLGANTAVGAAAGANTAFFNFAGATIKANATLTGVIPASTANYTFRSTVFGPITNNNSGNTAFNAQVGTSSNFVGGLVVDTNSFSVTFSNPLLGADGTVGVTQPDITIPTTGNSGYAGAPMVRFAAPAAAGGVPASGYALISGGQVTGIVVTNPGTYAAGGSFARSSAVTAEFSLIGLNQTVT